MSRKRSQHQPSKKSKNSENQTLYLAVTTIIIIAAIAALIFFQGPSGNNTDDTDINGSENDGTWYFAMDTDSVGSKYQASAIPTLVIINTEGNIIYYNRGLHTKDLLTPYIDSAIDGTADSLGEAPDFTLTTFNDKTFKLSDYKGKVVLIDLMAEYCGPCADQMPELQKIKLEKGEDVVILSVDVAYPNETENLVRETFGTYIKE
jgi:hypothetical protein